MLYPHLYIKSLLQEVKEQNDKLINHHSTITRNYALGNYIEDNYSKYIHEITLYIEQLNQEIVNTSKLIGEKK